jgi:hypothetical protein
MVVTISYPGHPLTAGGLYLAALDMPWARQRYLEIATRGVHRFRRQRPNACRTPPSGGVRCCLMTAELTDKRRTNDQGSVTVGGDRACDLLLREYP